MTCSRPLAVDGKHARQSASQSPWGLLRSRNNVNTIPRHRTNRLRTPETALLATGADTVKRPKNVWNLPPQYLIYTRVIIWRATNVDVNTCHWYFHDFLWFSALWRDILYGFFEEQQKIFFWKPPNFIDKYSGCGFNGPLWTMHEKSKKKWNYDRY